VLEYLEALDPWIVTAVMGVVSGLALTFGNPSSPGGASGRFSLDILESAAVGVVQTDRIWRIIFINKQARDLFTGGRNLTGCIFWEELPASVGTRYWQEYQRSITEQVPIEFTDFHARKGRWYVVRLFPSPEGLTVCYQECSDPDPLPEPLEVDPHLLSRAIETLPSGIVILDMAGQVRQTNAAARCILGCIGPGDRESFETLRGWWADTGKPVGTGDWAAIRAASREEVSIGEVLEIEGSDGKRRTVRSSAFPIRDKGGTPIGAVAVLERIPGKPYDV
jgi:PAS domain-containing protein